MNHGWDYTGLAAAYDLRPDYHAGLVARTLKAFGLVEPSLILDVGAGTGKLTSLLCRQYGRVIACEPNDAMRARGRRNADCSTATWIAADGERLPLQDASADMVSYGSSFNVLDAQRALRESARVLRPQGIWLALWNHRDLDDPLQREIEVIVHRHVEQFDYGTRRRDPSDAVAASRTFEPVTHVCAGFHADMPMTDWLQAWQSHATLRRQAGASFARILQDIAALVRGQARIRVPYHTRLWWARLRATRG